MLCWGEFRMVTFPSCGLPRVATAPPHRDGKFAQQRKSHVRLSVPVDFPFCIFILLFLYKYIFCSHIRHRITCTPLMTHYTSLLLLFI